MRRAPPAFLLSLAVVLSAAAQEVAAVRVQGNHRIGTAAILAKISTVPGSALEPERIREDIRSIYGMGYFRDVRTYHDRRTATLTFSVVEKTVVREVRFAGNKAVDTEDLRKEVETKAYGYLDENRIREDTEKLRKLYDGKGYYLAEIAPETEKIAEGEVRVTFRIGEEKKVRLRRITFLGNKVFSSKALRKVMRTKEKGFFSFVTGSGSFNEELFAEDRQILRDHYGHHGYIKAKIGAPRVALLPDRRSATLTIAVEEGEKYTVSFVGIDGEFIKPREELLKEIKLKAGQTADSLLIQQDMSSLSLAYADEGYAYVNVVPRDTYDEAERTVGVTYTLQPGPKVYVERVRTAGNATTRDKVLRRELLVREGDLFNATKIRESRQNLERMALFEKVQLTTPRASADDRVDLVVEITEKPTGTFSIGAGFNTLESFQVIAQLEKRNLFGHGVDVALQARVGARTQLYNLRYRDESFLDSRWGLTFNAFNIGRRYPDFDQTSTGGSLGFDREFHRKGLQRIRGGATYKLVNESLSDITPTVEQFFAGGVTGSVTVNVSRDTRNRVFEPTKGTYLLFTQEFAGKFAGGSNTFSKTEFDASWFHPVVKNSRIPVLGGSVFALHLNAGFVAPLEEGKRVPLFERYFPGGILSIRGFPLRSLGPKIPVASSVDPSGLTTTDFVYGGNKQIVFNAEYLFPIVPPANIKGVFFFDMGNAFDNGQSMWTITGLRQSAGFGIRWFSPIGPLRFEWGFPLDKTEDDRTVVFDFTIGSLF